MDQAWQAYTRAVEQALAVWNQAESTARQLRDQRAASAAQTYHSVLDRLDARARSAFQDYLNALANAGCGEESRSGSTHSGNWDWLDYAANFAAGWGDTLSFSVTNIVRSKVGINDGIDRDSATYSIGQWTGVAHWTAIGAAFGARFAATRSAASHSQWVIKVRPKRGHDGGISRHLIEKIGNETISVTHQVIKNGRVVHQHQTHVGKYGTIRNFPDDWIRFPRISVE